ncbi:MAG: hypothetical protein J7K15_01740 [Deltaproteobacteria bacterium]|nr:hypothetical protein [Deltaproteobacteria bacterium]
MGKVLVELTEENHKKLNILCILYKKTQDEIINMLLEKARVPGENLEFLVAGEEVETFKTEPRALDTSLDFLIAEEKKKK